MASLAEASAAPLSALLKDAKEIQTALNPSADALRLATKVVGNIVGAMPGPALGHSRTCFRVLCDGPRGSNVEVPARGVQRTTRKRFEAPLDGRVRLGDELLWVQKEYHSVKYMSIK